MSSRGAAAALRSSRLRAAALAVVAAAGLAACGGGSASSPSSTTAASTTAAAPAPLPAGPTEQPARPDLPRDLAVQHVGAQERGAWIVRRAADAEDPVVLFLHGWTANDPVLYGPWVAHLVREGNTVVYPVYQRFPFARPDIAFTDLVAGVRASLADARPALDRSRWVVAGHSAGAAFSSDYAARAADLELPPAAAIFSAYPGRMIRGIPLRLPESGDPAQIPASTAVEVLYGADDQTVGDTTAKRIAAADPRARLIRVDDPSVDDHLGPQRSGPATRRQFWDRLDALIRRVRG